MRLNRSGAALQAEAQHRSTNWTDWTRPTSRSPSLICVCVCVIAAAPVWFGTWSCTVAVSEQKWRKKRVRNSDQLKVKEMSARFDCCFSWCLFSPINIEYFEKGGAFIAILSNNSGFP